MLESKDIMLNGKIDLDKFSKKLPELDTRLEEEVMERFFRFCSQKQYSFDTTGLVDTDGERESQSTLVTGTLVVANLTGNFILARIISFVRSRKKYKVEDADETTENGTTVYELDPEDVLPLPCETVLEDSHPNTDLFGLMVDTKVLAMFPGTTSFYAATVIKRYCDIEGRLLGYRLKFEEDEDEMGHTQERLVSLYHVVKYNW